MQKGELTKINCQICSNTLFSVLNQELPQYYSDVILLGCKNCFQDGYKQWRYTGESLKTIAKAYDIKLSKRRKKLATEIEEAETEELEVLENEH